MARDGMCSMPAFVPGYEDRRGVGMNLLAALLDVRADEVLGVLLEHVVDLVENRVDILAELLPALLAGRRATVDIFVAVTATLPLRLLLGHVRLPDRVLSTRLPTGTDIVADHPSEDRDRSPRTRR